MYSKPLVWGSQGTGLEGFTVPGFGVRGFVPWTHSLHELVGCRFGFSEACSRGSNGHFLTVKLQGVT